MIANEVWVEIRDSRKIHSKREIRFAIHANTGIWRDDSVLFNTDVRRLLEIKAAAKGMAVIIERNCCWVTSSEYYAMFKVAKNLRYQITHGESLANDGNGVNVLQASTNPLARHLATLASSAGAHAQWLRNELDAIDAVLATTFDAGRAAARADFAVRRARA